MSVEALLAAEPPQAGVEAASDSPPATLPEKVRAKRFVISVEIDPPRSPPLRRTLAAATLLRRAGADCINVGDNPLASARMSAVTTAAFLAQQGQLEPIVHLSTRDRNRIALQADLMGAYAWGLRNILCVKGDPLASSEGGKTAEVWDVSAVGLLRMATRLNAAWLPAGGSIRDEAGFFTAAALNPAADDLDAEVRLARRKQEAGARFFIAQAIFDVEPLERLLEKLGPARLPILLGIWPLHNVHQLDFIQTRISPVGARLHDAMRCAGPSGEQCGVELAWDLIERVRPLVEGVYFIPSFGRLESIARLVAATRRLDATCAG